MRSYLKPGVPKCVVLCVVHGFQSYKIKTFMFQIQLQGNARKFVRKDVSVEAMAKAAVVPVNDKAGKAPDKSIVR